jgi:hypothetical protein
MVRANNRRTGGNEDFFSDTVFFVTALFFGIWILWDATFFRLVTYTPWADYWEHTAAFTEWLENFAMPGNPHAADPSLSPRYMPVFWALTSVGLLLGLDAIDLMSISAVINYLLIVIGVRLFMRDYFRDPWAPLIGFIAVFMFWGVSWNWSNLYQFRSFFYVAGFPSSLVFGLSLISFWLVLKSLRGDVPLLISTPLMAALAALMFVCHPLTGVFGIAGCGLLVLTENAQSVKYRIWILIALAAGVMAAELWPYFSVWKLTLGLYGAGAEKWFATGATVGPLERFQSGAWRHIFYDPKLVLVILGPALLGIPVCIWLLLRREYLFIAGGALIMSVPYFAHFFVEVPLAHRFLLFVAFYLQLALVWLILRVFDNWRLMPRPPAAVFFMWTTTACLAIVFAFNIGLTAIEFSGYTFHPDKLQLKKKNTRLGEGISTIDIFTQLTAPLPDSAIVLATPAAGWPLPTIKGKVVSLYHENPMLLDQDARYAATEAFFFEDIGEQRRIEIITHYGATHALTRTSTNAITQTALDWIDKHAVLLVETDDYKMYRLIRTGLDASHEATTEEHYQLPEAQQAIQPAETPASTNSSAQDADAAGDSGAKTYGAPIPEPMLEPEHHGG